MTWLPTLAIAGGLLTAFAAVEWALSRLEEAPQRRPRAITFLAAGMACILVSASFYLPAVRRPALGKPGTAGSSLAPFEQTQAEMLALVEQIIKTDQPPTLDQIQQKRRLVMDARRALARGQDPSSPIRPLENQSDAMLGVAYQTLGAQWLLVKQGNWGNRGLRESVSRQLTGELKHWQEIRDCLQSGRHNCSSLPELNESQQKIRNFNLWFHAYALELIRFNEEDSDLVDRSPAELARLRGLMVQAFGELPSHQLGPQGQPVLNAAASLIKVAENSLIQEASAVEKGKWSPQLQKVVYEPVQKVMEQYSRTLMCSAQINSSACMGSGSRSGMK